MSQQPQYFNPSWVRTSKDLVRADVVVYGGTAAGVIAAVSAKRQGKSAILLHPGLHLGGMTTGGLSYTDLGNKAAIGGAARQFYRDLGNRYGCDEEWKFEPHVAAEVLAGYVEDVRLDVRLAAFLDGVEVSAGRIREITMLGGLRVEGRAFIDATYEGDLLAAAGVRYTTGRESNDTYSEQYNGVQFREHHQFHNSVDPWLREGDPSSGLLPQVQPGPIEPNGTADDRVQAYNFRVCMTDDPDKRVEFPRPEGYDQNQYILVARWLRKPKTNVFNKFDRIRGGKTDTNNHGAASTDFIGASYGWPEGNYAAREAIFQAHRIYQQGLHWFMANDPAVPEDIRSEYALWGLAGDEFADTAYWPHQLYVREGRRMVAGYVVTDRDCLSQRQCDDPVGMGAYQMDSHNCRRFVDADGCLRNEGDVQVKLPRPYGLSYRSIIPKREVTNLAVPVAVSASHIAFGSIRMEPVFMILAQSAAIAACLAIDRSVPLQDVPYPALRDRLIPAGQVLDTGASNEGVAGNPK